MKARLQTLLFCILVYAMVGCQKEGYFVPQENDETGGEAIEAEILGTDVSEMNTAGPCTVLRMDGYTIAELYNPDSEPGVGTILLLYEQEKRAALISYTEEALLWYGINPQDGTPLEDFFAANAEKMMSGKMDWNTGTISEAKYFDMPSKQTKGVQTRSVDEMDFARQLWLDDLWRPLMSKVEDAANVFNLLPSSIAPEGFGLIPLIMKCVELEVEQTIALDGMNQDEVRQLHVNEVNFYILLHIVKSTIPKVSAAFSLGYAHTAEREKVTEDEVVYYSDMFTRSSRYGQQLNDWKDMPASRLFEMHASGPYDLTKNSAKIKGSYIFKGGNQGANIIQKGILWAKKSSEFPENGTYIAAPDGVDSWETMISGLEKATTYQACSYLSSTSGGSYYSNQIIFTTKGIRLAVSPTVLNCPAESNSKGIYVDTNDNAEWTIVSKPSWCSIKTKDVGVYSFFVDIKENTSIESRSGTITVQSTVTYDDGTKEEPLTATIAVTQEGKEEEPEINGSGFDHTKWNVTVAIKEPSQQTSIVLEFGDISKGEIYGNGMNIFEGIDGVARIQLESYKNNKLVFSLYQDDSWVHWRITYTLERFGNQLQGNVEGYMRVDPIEDIPFSTDYISGTISGTLIK